MAALSNPGRALQPSRSTEPAQIATRPANTTFEKPSIGLPVIWSWLFWGAIAWAFVAVIGAGIYQAATTLVGVL